MRKWLFPERIFQHPATGVKRSAALACSLTATLVVATSAQAQSPSDEFNEVEITPFFGYTAGGEFEDPGDPTTSADDVDRDLKEDNNMGVIVNLNADGPERQYEFLYSQQDTQVKGDAPLDLKVQYLQIGGIVNFMDEDSRVVPYFGITVGGARFTPDGPGTDSETRLAFSIGGGVKIPVTDHIGIRLDTRAFISLFDTDANIFCVSNPAISGCSIRAKSDTLVQYSGNLGITFGF